MNAREREKMLYLAFFQSKLGDYLEEAMEHHAKDAGRLRMAYNAVSASFRDGTGRMTNDELLKLSTDMRRKEISIDYRRANDFRLRANGDTVTASAGDLSTLAGYAIEFACQYCRRDQGQAAVCPLREALIGCNAVIGVDLASADCPYRGLHSQVYQTAEDDALAKKWSKANKGLII